MKKVIYSGIFFDERVYNTLKEKAPMLNKKIEYPHVTLEFKPKNLITEDQIGKYVEVFVTGQANDGKNQGFSVMLDDEQQSLYKNQSPPHITTSIDQIEGKAVDTGKLDFKLIVPFTIIGRIGYFTNKGVMFDNDFSWMREYITFTPKF